MAPEVDVTFDPSIQVEIFVPGKLAADHDWLSNVADVSALSSSGLRSFFERWSYGRRSSCGNRRRGRLCSLQGIQRHSIVFRACFPHLAPFSFSFLVVLRYGFRTSRLLFPYCTSE